MIRQIEFQLPAYTRGFHLITASVEDHLGQLPNIGLLHLFIKHSAAGLTINENADPTVRSDMQQSFDRLVKERESFYEHIYEGDDDMPAHIKSTLIGSSVSIPISNGRLNLGTWQGIYLGEFRNVGGRRSLVATIQGA